MMDDDILLPESDVTKDQTDQIDKTEALIVCAFNCTEQNVKNCRKCNRPFCIIHCNTFSPNFCKDCFKDLTIVSEKFKRTFDHIADNGQQYIKTEERTKWYMDGPDWPFVTPWLDSLTDDELKSLWVFHHCVMRLIESENETRKIEHYRKIREAAPSTRLITGTTTTSTKTVRTVKAVDTADDVRKKLRKQGIAENIIDMMIASMGVK
jgi:hypothetical protein